MSITDGSVVCALCGEWMTSCSLCRGHESLITVDLRAQREAERAADHEERMQEQSIRRAADRRWLDI